MSDVHVLPAALAAPADPADLEAVHRVIEAIARKELRIDHPFPRDLDLAAQLDSIQRLALVVAIEDQLRICFEPEDEEQAVTLDDVVRIVSRHLVAQAECGA